MIKAVVFDLDDTLISEKEYIKSSFVHVSQIIKRDFLIESDVISDIMYEFSIDSKKVFNRVLKKLGLNDDINYIKKLVYEYRNHIPNIRLYDDAEYTLSLLKKSGFKLGIITDGYKEVQKNKIEVLNIKSIFDSIIITDEIGREYWKPHKLPYIKSSDELGVKFEEMVYVGDNVNKDFVTANSLGILTIQVQRENGVYCNVKSKPQYDAKIKVNSLEELIKYIKV